MTTQTITDREAEPRREGFLRSPAFRSSLAQPGKYRPDVDGLRAVAVLAVLFFHGQILECRGGYVGVDVFFVISGYLITSLLARDMAEGKFSFMAFYERRMRRIFPALFAVLFFCVAAAAVLLPPDDLHDFGKALVATTFFVSNIEFLRNSGALGYFSHASEFQALLHTWSLSVEEQFYLVFPTALLVIFRFARKRVSLCLFILAAISFALNIWVTKHEPFSAFYLSVPRGWELLTGALLATGALPPLRNRIARELAGLLGLGLIVVAVFCLTRTTPFPGYAALLPCLGAGLLIYAGEHGNSCATKALGFPPLVFIGVISYSLYLWHWPLLVFSRYFMAGELTGTESAVALACAGLMAFVSFKFIERPFRGARSAFTRRQIFAWGLAASAMTAAIGFTAYLTHGLPQRYDASTRRLMAENLSRRSDYDESCGNWRTNIRSMADIQFCTIGTPSARKVMFLGDSHVGQMMPVVRAMVSAGTLRGDGALFAIADGCLPVEHLNTPGGYHCDSFAHFAILRALQPDIDAVFIAFSTEWAIYGDAVCASADRRCTKMLSLEETKRSFLEELSEEIHALRADDKPVIVCLPFPIYDKSIPELEMRNLVLGKLGLSMHATDLTSQVMREDIRSTAISAGAQVFDPRATLCPGGNCITEMNGVSIYKDNHHLAESQVGILGGNLEQVLH